MAGSKMKEVAKLLGVEIGEKFEIENGINNPYHFSLNGIVDKHGCYDHIALTLLLNGEAKIKKQILTDKEKCYLEGVLKPFKEKNIFIVKKNDRFHPESEYLIIYLNENADIYDIKNREEIVLPFFRKDSMYRDMELRKEYNSKELRLFEESRLVNG